MKNELGLDFLMLWDLSNPVAVKCQLRIIFTLVLEGTPTLILGGEEYVLKSGYCCGFKAGEGVEHQLVNNSKTSAVYLEIGDRTPGDEAEFPHDDLKATQLPGGKWTLTHKDGTPY